ncbi:hypothetical protein [Saccharothrix saharensis]|uniref:hypothetical protein n=1 Tax=Saccharothrix saharensis TaxID=571190 RepID=UPI00114E7FB8|nr:hypothetical protein [Saccharothrix saharensis]
MTDTPPQQPDPDHMIRFCRELLPEILVKASLVKPSEAAAVGENVLARATAFAALPQQTQDVLAAPFAEEVFDHKPTTAPLDMLAATTVVVRNSRLELSHFSGLVEPGTLRMVTETALGPLSHLLAAARRGPVALTGPDPFENLAATYPRAWTCLEALAETVANDSGRRDYRAPQVDGMPSLPESHEVIPDRRAKHTPGGTLFDSVDPRFDEEFLRQLRVVVDQDGDEPKVFFVSALSRFSRNAHKQLRVVELLLAHEVTILTTNYMLRPHDVWVRRGTLVKPDSHNPLTGLHRLQGLTGAHRHMARRLLDTMRTS